MKMRELEQRTGVNRETIRVYLRQGLLPEPRRVRPATWRTTARSTSAASSRSASCRREQRLPLARIKRALEGDAVACRRTPGC